MNRTIELRQRRDALLTEVDNLRKIASDAKRPMTTDEKSAVKAKLDEVESIVEDMQLEERAAKVSGQAAAAAASSPTGTATTDNTTAHAASTTVHDNYLDKPWWPEAMQPKSTESKEQRQRRLAAGFGEQLKAIRMVEQNPQSSINSIVELRNRLNDLTLRAAPAGAGEQVPADGGFLIHPDFSQEIMVIAHDTGLVYTNARKLPLSSATNAIKIPGIDEQSRVDGSRWGGVRMYWQNEADALIGSKPKFRAVELVMKKLTGLFYATDELIADAAMLGGVVTQAFGEEVGFKLDDAAINGDGAGKPQGVMKANCLITLPKETGQASQTIVTQNVVKMYYRLHMRSRKNSVWYVNQDCEQQLLQLVLPVGTGGSSVVDGMGPVGGRLYTPPGVNPDGYGRLFGRPVVPIEQAQTLGTTGDIILADMTQWVYADKGDVQQATSMHVRFLTDEMTYRWILRCDGQPIWHTALTPFNGSNTLSPFIALANR